MGLGTSETCCKAPKHKAGAVNDKTLEKCCRLRSRGLGFLAVSSQVLGKQNPQNHNALNPKYQARTAQEEMLRARGGLVGQGVGLELVGFRAHWLGCETADTGAGMVSNFEFTDFHQYQYYCLGFFNIGGPAPHSPKSSRGRGLLNWPAWVTLEARNQTC